MSAIERVSCSDTHSNLVRQYGTRFQLFLPTAGYSRSERAFFATSKTHPNMGGETDQMTAAGWRAVDGIFRIDGISYLIVRPFEINVGRCSAFDWPELHDEIMHTIRLADPRSFELDLPAIAPRLQPARRIRWFDTRSDQVRHYGLTAPLFVPQHSLDNERHYRSTYHERPLLNGAQNAMEALFRINGISAITIRPFELNIFRYEHYTFNEMHAAILAAIKLAFPSPTSYVDVQMRAEW